MPDGSNGPDRQFVETLLTEIDDADDRLASLKGEYMASCKAPRQDITTVFERAKEAGMTIRAFRALVKNRRLDRQMAGNVKKLEADDQVAYDDLVTLLGDFCDLPLGQAALSRARPMEHEAALDSVTAPPPTSGYGAPSDPQAESQIGRG